MGEPRTVSSKSWMYGSRGRTARDGSGQEEGETIMVVTTIHGGDVIDAIEERY